MSAERGKTRLPEGGAMSTMPVHTSTDEPDHLIIGDLTEHPWFREQERAAGPLGVDGALSHLADMLSDLLDVLHASDRDTAAPGQVVAFVDGASRLMHEVRADAVGESRRRMDAAMERSAALLAESRARRAADG